jgi:hypothetical protein
MFLFGAELVLVLTQNELITKDEAANKMDFCVSGF